MASEETRSTTQPASEKQVAPTVEAKSPSTRWSTLTRLFWPVLAAAQAGVLVMLFFLWPETPKESQTTVTLSLAEEDVELSEAASVLNGDNRFRAGRYDLALKHYRECKEANKSVVPDFIRYRVALALEGMGHFDKAKAAYRDLASSTSQLSIAVASHLGIARVCLKGNEYQEARELLGRLHLRRDSSEWPAELRDETRYLYAFSLVGAQLQEEPGPYNQALVGFSLGTLELERYLDWPLTGPNPGENTRPIQPKGPINVVLAAKNPIESLVSIQLVDVRVADLIDRLGQEVGFKANWEPDTLGEIQEQLISVQLENVEAGHLLDELATVLGIAWRSKGGTIRFARSDSKVVLPTLAQRALREALLSQPGHPLGPAVMLELGRLEAKAGKNIGASAWFERVLESSPRSPVGVSAAYNLGQVQFRLGQYPSARENWFRVIDQAPEHRLVPLAYYWIGRSYLETRRLKLAISHLRRSASYATDKEQQAAACCFLASAYLLDHQPKEAIAALLEHRQSLVGSTSAKMGSFLLALGRFQLANDRERFTSAAPNLLSSLKNLKEKQPLGLVGMLLMGRAYLELGLDDRAIVLFEKELAAAQPGDLADEMGYLLAEAYQREAQPTLAKKYLEPIVARNGMWSGVARFRLAEIALHARHPENCLDLCRELIADPKTVDREALLHLMGQAYAATGDLDKAALCFAGKNPF